MGAVAAILLASEHPEEVTALILDSPFSDLTKMVKDVVTSERNLPRCLIGCVLGCLARSAKKRCGTDIREVVPLQVIHKLASPVFFMVAKQDLLARAWRVKELFEMCGSLDKTFFLIEGDHCSQRDSLTMRKASNFIFKRQVLDNFRKSPVCLEETILTPEDNLRLLSEGNSLSLYDLKTSHISDILRQAQLDFADSNPNSPSNIAVGIVDLNWPSATLLKKEVERKPDVEMLHSRVENFENLQKEIIDIKKKSPMILKKPLQMCINARTEE